MICTPRESLESTRPSATPRGNRLPEEDCTVASFGTFVDPTQVPFLGLTSPRTLSPGAPLGVFGGVRVKF